MTGGRPTSPPTSDLKLVSKVGGSLSWEPKVLCWFTVVALTARLPLDLVIIIVARWFLFADFKNLQAPFYVPHLKNNKWHHWLNFKETRGYTVQHDHKLYSKFMGSKEFTLQISSQSTKKCGLQRSITKRHLKQIISSLYLAQFDKYSFWAEFFHNN